MPDLVEQLAKDIHDGLGGNGWAYRNYGGDEWNSCRPELRDAAKSVIERLLPIILHRIASVSIPGDASSAEQHGRMMAMMEAQRNIRTLLNPSVKGAPNG